MSDKIDINEIHPDMEPIDSAPSLFSFYGFGLGLFGNRDFSTQTQSSIKTLFITLAFVPVIPLRAYRVAKDGASYYFLGRVPVSKFARTGSLAAILLGGLAIAGFGTQQYISSDKYINGKAFAKAEASVAQGELPEAMNLYKDVYDNSVYYKQQTKSRIRNLVRVKTLKDTDNKDFANVLSTLNSFSPAPMGSVPEDVYQLAITRIKNNDSSDNISVHRLLHAASDLNVANPDGTVREDLSSTDMGLILSINKSDPTNLEAAVELSEHYYAQEKMAAVKTVLAPVKDRLADTEAARILGQIFISEGKNAEAYPLLSSYTSGRLKILQAAEKKFTTLQNLLWDTEFNRLNSGRAPQSFYDAYDKKSETEQQLYVDEYIGTRINNNASYKASLESYREASAIVPVVMDFGILQLRTAETMTSETARNTELKAAEKTFLSIKNIVGDTDEYKIYLGEVYFWLGKQAEGQVLFDEILAANSRSANALLQIAGTLRSLGKVGLSTELSQEAYDNSKDDEMRYAAANYMHLLSNTTEEKITWLKRADPKAPYVQAALKENQGHLAAGKGQTKTAAKFYREAIRHSESITESASNYNNTALIYFSLHRVSGDKTAYQKGVELMSKAVELRPDESILLSNAASTLVTNSLYETLGDRIDYQYLQNPPSLNSVGHYYKNIAGKKALRSKVASHKDLQKAREYLQRSILLSPNSAQNYEELYSIYYFLDDQEAIADLASKMAKNQVDVSATNKKYIEFAKGVDMADNLVKIKDREKFYKGLLAKKNVNRETASVLHNLLAENLITQVTLGDFKAANKAVDHAKIAVRNFPSSAAQSTLSTALLTRASIEAAEKYPSYKTMRAKSVRNMSDSILVTLMMNKNDEVANWLKSNANVKQAIAIEANEYKNFPDYTSPRIWALFKASNNPQTDNLARAIQTSKLRKSMQEISEYSAPLSGSTLAYKHWMNQASNKPAIEQSRFDKLEKQGIVLPTQLFQ